MTRIVIIGASVAGVHVATTLRNEGFEGNILLVGDEEAPPYDKPALSKQMLTGDGRHEQVSLLPGERASDLNLQLRLGSPAVHLDAVKRTVRLADESAIAYDQLVIATGSHARQPTWATNPGVLTLRTLADSAQLRLALREYGRVVVVGAGFIGAEVAAAAHALGREVTVVDPLSAPLARLLGPEVGALLGDIHERHGVRTRFNVGVTSVQGHPGNLSVKLSDGSTIDTDLVVAGIGAAPNDAWLSSSGLAVDDGVLCDQYCRVLGHKEIYAAGDVARWQDPRVGHATRVEHWTNAVEQGAHVARNMLAGTPIPYQPLHYVWSDQYDWKLQFVSIAESRSAYEVLGDVTGENPHGVIAYGDEDGRFVAALSLNHPRGLMNARRMLRAGLGFDEVVRTLRETVLKHRS